MLLQEGRDCARRQQARTPLAGTRLDQLPEAEVIVAAEDPVVDRLQRLDQCRRRFI